jgi:hypothetical protein
MFNRTKPINLGIRAILPATVLVGFGLVLIWFGIVRAAAPMEQPSAPDADEYIVLAWNDLGMHCYNRDFKDLAVLPPFNTLWAQVIKVGDPPEVITTGVTVKYSFADNTYSVGKSNFWDYDQQLFGVDLDPNVGLFGFGLSGDMEVKSDHFEAVGIPLTEFRDSAPSTPYPYQMATVVVEENGTGTELARLEVVAPVSTEMHCDYCHSDHGQGNEDIATGVVEQNILTKHDEENMDDYPPGHTGALMNRRPILCAECHSSNALGAPGVPGIPSLSNAMHEKHDGKVPDTNDGCYNCHPGPVTKCLRDVMSQRYGMTCVDCHGTMYRVSHNPNPWLNEPRCDDPRCHGSAYQQNNALYRMSSEHGGVYCEGCHDSTHAIAPSREGNDWIKFIALQRRIGPLTTCTVCHTTWPTDPGPHNLIRAEDKLIYLPLVARP